MGTTLALLTAWLVVFCATPSWALDPSRPLSQYGRRFWSEADGLTAGSVYALAQDRDGHLWLGTDSGLIRFDGTEFVRWGSRGEEALAGSQIRALVAARDGSLWIGFGGAGGISRIHEGRVVNYTSEHGLAQGWVLTMFEDADGAIWAGGLLGVSRFLGGRWSSIGEAEGLPAVPVLSSYYAQTGKIWVSTRAGTFQRDAGKARFEFLSEMQFSNMQVEPDGAIWMIDLPHGLQRLDFGDTPFKVISPEVLSGRTLEADASGNLWLGTLAKGLWRVRRNNRGRSFSVERLTDQSLMSLDVWDILEDRDHNLWVGTGRGLLRLSDSSITMVTNAEASVSNKIQAVAVGTDGIVWVGTPEGLYRVVESSPREYVLRREMRRDVLTLHVDRTGVLWVATRSGVGRFDGRRFVPLPVPKTVDLSLVYAIVSDHQDGLWLCDFFTGIVRWHNGQLQRFDNVPAASRRPCGSASVDDTGRVWFGLRAGGVLAYADGRFQSFGEQQGIVGSGTTTVSGGRQGRVWITTPERLLRFDRERFDVVATTSNLPAPLSPLFVEDMDGTLWLGLTAGVLNMVPSSDRQAYQFRLFDVSDGLTSSIPASVWGSPYGARSPDGRLWFATGNGLAVIEPARVRPERSPGIPRVEMIVADDKQFLPNSKVILPPRTSKVEFRYASLNLSGLASLRFRYRLEGFDTDWVEAGTRRQAFYTNLPPRTYTFHVAAGDGDGGWIESGVEQPITIRPAFHQTASFYVLCAIGGALLLGGAAWMRLRVEQNRFKSILAERARVGREIHDTLLQNLGSVSLELEVVASQLRSAPDAAVGSLQRLRRQVTQCVRDARESIWHLRSPIPDNSDLADVLRQIAHDLVAKNGPQLGFVVTGSSRPCGGEVREQLVRITQEAISNALRHGRPTAIDIELEYHADSIFLRVSDNGCGFEVDKEVSTVPGHWGLISMHERAATVGGSLAITSDRESGTRIETVVPLIPEF